MPDSHTESAWPVRLTQRGVAAAETQTSEPGLAQPSARQTTVVLSTATMGDLGSVSANSLNVVEPKLSSPSP